MPGYAGPRKLRSLLGQRDLRQDAILDPEIRHAARLERPRPVFARRQRHLDDRGGARGKTALNLDVPGGDRAGDAIGADADRADLRIRLEGDLDIAREVAAVIDIAGRAMRPLRQLRSEE